MAVTTSAVPLATSTRNDLTPLLRANDPILAKFILSTTESERNEALQSVLLTHAKPVIERVLRRVRDSSLGGEGREDIASAAMLRLVHRLHVAASDARRAIASVADFTATLTFHAVHDVARRRAPCRTQFKNRLRSVLARDARFRTFDTPNGLACALAHWPARLATRPLAPNAIDRAIPRHRHEQAVAAILGATGAPVLLDELARALAEAWGIDDPAPVDATAIELADRKASFAVRLETQQVLALMWREIVALPAAQRAALLLNLRDTDQQNALALFVRVGIATSAEIAAAAGMTAGELAVLWNELPLDDLRIAARLGVSRQQVINLRKSARARLSRRMARV